MRNKIKLLVFLIAKICGLFLFFKWQTRHQVRVLCYHGGCVGDENDFNPNLFCTAAFLQERMHWLLRNGFKFVSLDDVMASAGKRSKANFQVAITFDDGWDSTATELLPLLGKLNIPSTLYLCTEHYAEAWSVVAVTVRYIAWKTVLSSVEICDFHEALNGKYDLSSASSRESFAIKAERIICRSCKEEGTVANAHRLLNALAEALGISMRDLNLASKRFQYVSEVELKKLGQSLCAVELHGHVHQYPFGSPLLLRNDLIKCRQIIEAAGLPRPVHYCYPSGDFDGHAVPMLEELGVLSATTCNPGLVKAKDLRDLYRLPRFLDGGHITQLEFDAEMCGFSAVLRSLKTNMRWTAKALKFAT